MSSKWSTLINVCAIVGITAAVIGVLALICEEQNSMGFKEGRKTAYTEAVKAGSARWVLDEKGESKIEWIVPSEKKP